MQGYDVIIVGAGSAGCVLAARLSEDPDRRVLLMEAGGSDRVPEVRIPAAFTKLFRGPRDYAYWTEPQTQLDDRSLFWPRGKMLGGCSSMNAQLWVRGHAADFADWRASAGPLWSEARIEAAFRKAERRPGASDRERPAGQQGPRYISDQREPNITSQAFLRACAEYGLRPLQDLNGPHDGGFALAQVTQSRGQRMSAADAYLRPALARDNLTVMTCAQVRRILFDGRRARGVEYAAHSGEVRRAQAREVIVSAGTIGSPHLLMCSGVGPGEVLAKHGIARVCESPEVGENLQDHLLACWVVRAKQPVSLVRAQSPLQVLRYLALRRGMLTSPVAEALAFVKTEATLPAPDIELIWAPVPFVDHGMTPQKEHGLTVGVVLLQPKSRGVIRVRAADPSIAPAIDPRYLSDPNGQDLQRLCAGLRVAQQLLRTRALAAHVGSNMEPSQEAPNEQELGRFVREQAETLYHPVGTCRMGSDAGSVVDPELRVRGVDGLSVVDASIMPTITRGHTHAPTTMLAEVSAEIIADRLRGSKRRERVVASATDCQ